MKLGCVQIASSTGTTADARSVCYWIIEIFLFLIRWYVIFCFFFLQKVNWVVDSKSWLIIWPNCMIASVTGGIEWSALPKTRMLTFRALGKAAPLEARRIDWIPFFHPVSQCDINYSACTIFIFLSVYHRCSWVLLRVGNQWKIFQGWLSSGYYTNRQ